MTVPDTDRAADSSTGKPGPVGVTAAATSQPPGKPVIPAKFFAKAKQNNIHLSPAVLDAAARDGDALLRSLRTTPEGLTQAEAESRARTAGPNEVAQERPRGWFIRLLIILRNPLVILLAVLSSISFATGDARAGTVMACMVVLSVTLRFVQEARADAAAAKLKAMIHVTATVVRDGSAREMPLRDLVPGDVVKLSAGDMIPGDVRLLSAKDLFVSQGSLTGESMPVEKFHDPETAGLKLAHRAEEHLLHGDQRGKRHGDRGGGGHGRQHLSRQHGRLDHRAGSRRPASTGASAASPG